MHNVLHILSRRTFYMSPSIRRAVHVKPSTLHVDFYIQIVLHVELYTCRQSGGAVNVIVVVVILICQPRFK